MEQILLDASDEDRIFSESQMAIIHCVYFMNDLELLLGDDWNVDYPSFTPTTSFFKVRVRKMIYPERNYNQYFERYVKLSLNTYKIQMQSGWGKYLCNIGKKNSTELAEYLRTECEKTIENNKAN